MKNAADEIQSKLEQAANLLDEVVVICDGLRHGHAHRGTDGFFEVSGVKRSVADANRTLERAKRQAQRYSDQARQQARRGSQRGK